MKAALKKYKEHFFDKTSSLALFAFFLIASYALMYFYPFTAIILVPFIVAPFLFVFQAMNSNANSNIRFSFKDFFKLYPRYYSPSYYGVYRLIISTLKALLVYMAFFVSIGIIGGAIISAVDPAINDLVNQIYSVTSYEEMYEIIDTLLARDSFYIYMLVTYVVSFFFAFWMFIHSVGISSLSFYCATHMRGAAYMRQISYAYRFAFKRFRRQFYRDYFKANFLGIILLVVGMLAGVLLGYYLNFDLDKVVLFGLYGASFLLFFFLPYYFDVLNELYIKYFDYYQQATIDLAKMNIERLKAAHNLSEEELEKLNNFLAKAEEKKEDNNVSKPIDGDDTNDNNE